VERLLSQLPLTRVLEQLDHPPTMEVLRHDTLDDWWQPRLLDGMRRELTMPGLPIAGWVDRAQAGLLLGTAGSIPSPSGSRKPGSGQELYFSGTRAGELSSAVTETASHLTYRYDPMDPIMPSGWGKASYNLSDQSYLDGREDVLWYTSPPQREEVATSGWPRVTSFASSDCDDTEWHVRLADMHPDGRSYEIAAGGLRASLTPFCRVTPSGSLLPAATFPAYAPSLNRFGSCATLDQPRIARQTIYHGPNSPSRIMLPVTPGSLSS
jgi:predicted acyl esterase